MLTDMGSSREWFAAKLSRVAVGLLHTFTMKKVKEMMGCAGFSCSLGCR